jgi:hypothetical protein
MKGNKFKMIPRNILPDGVSDYIDLPLETFDMLDDFIPTEVCHYTSKETALEKILGAKKILLGQLGFTNDPRESKPGVFAYFSWGEDLTEIAQNPHEVNNEVNRIKREEWRVLCTSCHNDPALSFMESINASYIDHHRFGVSYSRMWAHYGGNHAGVCLLFDGQKLDNNIRESLKDKHCEIRHGFVKYDYAKSVAEPPTTDSEFQSYGTAEMIRKTLIKHYDKNFLYKSNEWKTEHEFRWLVHSEDYPNNSQMLIPIEGAIKAIVVGVDFSDIYIPSLRILCEQLDIPPACKISWKNGRPFVNPLWK